MNYPKNRKYSDETIRKRTEKSLEDTKRLLKEKNIPFEIVGPYINKATKTKFKCMKCGEIKEYIPHNILNNHCGCIACGQKRKRTYEMFLEDVKNIDSTYQVLSTEEELRSSKNPEYIDTNKYCRFLHTVCGCTSLIKSSRFLGKDSLRCTNCSSNKKHTNNEINEKLNNIYNGTLELYGDYNGRHNLMSVKCKVCNRITTDYAFNFLTNHRLCSFCAISKSEKLVKDTLPDIDRNISYDGMTFKENLTYDFKYNNINFESDGIQHFKSIEFFGGDKEFKIRQRRDLIKNLYSINNKLTLIRIFNEDINSPEKVKMVFNFSPTTIESLDKEFKNILVIYNGNILLRKGLYNSMQVEYTQASGNEDEKDIV